MHFLLLTRFVFSPPALPGATQPIMIAPGDSAALPRFPRQPFGDPDDPVSTRDCL